MKRKVIGCSSLTVCIKVGLGQYQDVKMQVFNMVGKPLLFIKKYRSKHINASCCEKLFIVTPI